MDGTLALKKYNVVERLEALEEGGGYELPVASASTLGGVKIGEGLSITEGGVLTADGGVVDYSTTEQATGRKWIDGSTIYECVFVLASPLTVGDDWVATGITIPNVTRIINAFGLRNNGATFIPLNAHFADTDEIKVSKESRGWNDVTHIILQYTKTTPTKKKK